MLQSANHVRVPNNPVTLLFSSLRLLLFEGNSHDFGRKVRVCGRRQERREVVGAFWQATLAAHLIEVHFAFAGLAERVGIEAVLDNVIEFVQQSPADVERCQRASVSHQLIEVSEINLDNEHRRTGGSIVFPLPGMTRAKATSARLLASSITVTLFP